MRLTQKKAIEIALELWRHLAESGGGLPVKANWEGWTRYGRMDCNCSLCEYVCRQKNKVDVNAEEECPFCPYCKVFDLCHVGGQPYNNWMYAETSQTRKKYASEIVAQLEQLIEMKVWVKVKEVNDDKVFPRTNRGGI